MKVKKKALTGMVVLALVAGIGLMSTILFGLSRTHDSYACYKCKSVGRSHALRAWGMPIWREKVNLWRSVTDSPCAHQWIWYFANSRGLLLCRRDWDGPIGKYPFHEEFIEKETW